MQILGLTGSPGGSESLVSLLLMLLYLLVMLSGPLASCVHMSPDAHAA